MMRIVDFHEGRGLGVIRVDDPAIVFLMLGAQQRVQFGDEDLDALGLRGFGWRRFPDGIQKPAGVGSRSRAQRASS